MVNFRVVFPPEYVQPRGATDSSIGTPDRLVEPLPDFTRGSDDSDQFEDVDRPLLLVGQIEVRIDIDRFGITDFEFDAVSDGDILE